jgi:hypothetical protein
LDGVPPPTPAQVTRAVRRLIVDPLWSHAYNLDRVLVHQIRTDVRYIYGSFSQVFIYNYNN